MAGFFVKVTGKRVVPIGGFREKRGGFIYFNASRAEGLYTDHFDLRILCREGNETSVPAPKGAHCSPGSHVVKEGSDIYYLGLTSVCPAHLHFVPTLEQTQRKYAQPWYSNVSIEKEKKE